LLLVGGGSGVVPLLSMLRHRAGAGSQVPTSLVYSARTGDDLIAADELRGLAAGDPSLHLLQTLTRGQPPGWTGYSRRIDADMLTDALRPLGGRPMTFICGPTLLVEAAAETLVGLGLPPASIKTERFGPTGS
jgi:ferredoxin-NADP reductase